MYTDDYVEENEEYESEEEKTIVKDNNKDYRKIIIIIMIALIIGLVAYLIYKKIGNKKEDTYALSLYPSEIIISIGESKNISYEVRKNGEVLLNSNVRLTIENDAVATVDNLTIKGVYYGKTVLKATYVSDDGKTIEEIGDVIVADGSIEVPVTSISIPDGDLEMPLNGTYDIPLTIEPENGYVENKAFNSTNPNVAIVDNNGKVTAISEGNAVITIDVNNGKFVKELNVHVRSDVEKPDLTVKPTSISIINSITKITEGESATLMYVLTPENASSDGITWSSSDPNIIKIDNDGKITAIAPGTATIKVEINGLSSTAVINVEGKIILPTDISLSTDTLNMVVGGSEIIIPTVTPVEATDKSLTYTSLNPEIASISPNETDGATIVAISSGTATISIKTSNGVEKTISVIVIDNIEPTTEPTDGGSSGGSSSCKKTCSDGKYVKNCKCVTCEENYYCKDGKKAACPSGYSSKAGSSSCTRSSCPAGTYLDSTYSTGCRPCPSGKYCTGGTNLPKTCANGKIPNDAKTACKSCSISNCASYGGNGTSCKCISCKDNYQVNSTGTACTYISKPCSSRSTVGECNASSSCKWDYTYGCRNK